MNILKKDNPGLADNPGELLNLTQQLTRDWPEGVMASPCNLAEQAEGLLSLNPENTFRRPFEQILKNNGILLENLKQTKTEALEQIPEHLREIPHIQDILSSSLGGEHFVSEEIDRLVESGLISSKEGEQMRAASMMFTQHEGERTSVMEPEQTSSFIDNLAGKSASERSKIFKEIAKEAEKNPKAVCLDDQKLFTMLTISCGPEIAGGYAEFIKNEKARNLGIEGLEKERQRLNAELSKTSTSDPRYKTIRDQLETIRDVSAPLYEQQKKSWKNFKADHSFEKTAPKEFLEQQDQLGEQWKNSLMQEEAQTELGLYREKINGILNNPQVNQAQRDKQVQVELLKMLNYAKDTAGLPGKINIKSFDSTDIRNGYASGNSIYLNSDKMIVDGKADFDKIFRVLFHESGHVLQHQMSSNKKREIFGETEDLYMESKISSDLYKLQPVEQHSDFMGSKAKDITKGWNK